MRMRVVLSFAAGPVGAAGLGLVALPLAAWIFSPTDIGRMNILQVSLVLTTALASLGLDQTYVRGYHEAADKPRLLLECWLPGALVLTAVSVPALLWASDLAQAMFGARRASYIVIAVACSWVAFAARFTGLVLRMQERGLAFSMGQILPKAVLLLGIVSVGLWGSNPGFSTFATIFLGSSATALVVTASLTRHEWSHGWAKGLSRERMTGHLAFGVPLLLAGVAYWGLQSMSSITLRSVSTLHELGVYSIVVSCAGFATIAQSVFSTLWAPYVYRNVAEGTDLVRIDSAARIACALACAVFAMAGLFGWVIALMLPEEYAGIEVLLAGAMAPPLLYTLSEITSVGAAVQRRTVLLMWGTVGALVTNLVACLSLVPRWGATGAVCANAIAFLVFFVLRSEASVHAWQAFERRDIYVNLVLVIGVAIAVALAGPGHRASMSLVWSGTLAVSVWTFRTEWRRIVAETRHLKLQRLTSS